jgi:hypothetical protein
VMVLKENFNGLQDRNLFCSDSRSHFSQGHQSDRPAGWDPAGDPRSCVLGAVSGFESQKDLIAAYKRSLVGANDSGADF